MDEFAGALSERVVVERWTASAGEAGEDVGAWAAGVPAWAEVRPSGVGAAVEAEQPARRPRYRVRLRGSRAADLASRLLWRGRTLDVLSAAPDPAADRLELLVEDRA